MMQPAGCVVECCFYERTGTVIICIGVSEEKISLVCWPRQQTGLSAFLSRPKTFLESDAKNLQPDNPFRKKKRFINKIENIFSEDDK